MIKVFNSTDKTYSTNGNIVLKPTIANVHKEDNGDFYLDLETIFDEKEVKIQPEAGTIVSSQDASLTITDANTLKEVELTNIQGNTTQSGTPTPSSPQPINVVSGRQDIVVCGSNIFDNNSRIVGGNTGTTGAKIDTGVRITTANANTNRFVIYRLGGKELLGKKITISTIMTPSGTNNGAVRLYEINDGTAITSIPGTLRETGTITYTIPSSYTVATNNGIGLLLSANSSSTTSQVGDYVDYTNLMVEIGETATPYQEYKGQIYEINLGKNLFNINGGRTDSSCASVVNNNTLTQTNRGTYCRTIWKIDNLVVGQKYTLNYDYINENGSSIQVRTYRADSSTQINGSPVSTATSGNQFVTFTPLDATCYLRFYSNTTNTANTNTVVYKNIQLETGGIATTYTPYKTPIELCKIGEYQDFIKKGTGKNLYSGSDTLEDRFTYLIPSEIGKTYTLSFKGSTTETGGGARVFFRNCDDMEHTTTIDNEVVSLTSTVANYSLTLTPTANGYLFIALAGTASNFTFQNIMLEEGNTATPYEPYGMYNKWYIEKQIGKVVLNGSENWSAISTSTSGKYRMALAISDIKRTSTTSEVGKVLSNYYTPVAYAGGSGTYNNVQGISVANNNSNIAIYDNTYNTSADTFKTWLSTHNTIVYYVLATPTYTEITDSELIGQLNALRLLEGLNNISITSGDLAGEITIHYNYLDAASESIRYVDYLVPNNIVVANTPQGEQAFRITNVEKTKRKIKIKAYHVFYDTENYLIQDSYVVDKNCNDALDHLNNATDNTSPFTTISNITTIDSYRCVRKSLYEAIQVVIERWGGHLVRDNWTIGVYNTIGQDNGVTIRYGKNLKDITASYNWDEVVTKLLPVGKDGLLLNAIDPTASVYVESTIQYDIPYTKTISFNQDNVNEDDYKDEQGNLDEDAYKQALVNDLLEQGQNYIAINCIPKVNYTLDANVEKISDIGDSIEVIDEKLGINIMTNIISYDYNCILNKYTQLEFGNFTPELKNLMTTINEATEKIIEEQNSTLAITLNQELNEATSKIWNALGNSYVIYDGDKILIVDSLPKETATNVIMINNGGIGFSQTGITGTFQSAWTIDNVLNMEQINVINLTADLIKGGTLKLGSNLNQNGKLEVYDESNTLIAELNKNGLKMYGADGSYVLLNNSVGFAGYDRNNNPNFWVNRDEFHMRKAFAEEEITLVNKMRIIPITLYNNGTLVNDGIGFINVAGGGN